MMLASTKVLLLSLGVCLNPARALLFSQFEDPVVSFINHASLVLGNHLYINGGSILPKPGVEIDVLKGSIPPNNVTLAIDLRSAWNNRSISPHSIPSHGHERDFHAIFGADTSGISRIYAWSGRNITLPAVPYVHRLDVLEIEKGDATWTEAKVQPPKDIRPTTDGTYARTPDEMYCVAGSDYPKNLGGLIRYEFSPEMWKNISYSRQNFDVSFGAGWNLPTYGHEGILIFLGGEKLKSTFNSLDSLIGNLQSLGEIRIYDVHTMETGIQTATGIQSLPPKRIRPCIVGVKDIDGGGYDIFMYGGTPSAVYDSTTPTKEHRSVWVLSLPSFRWIEIPGSTTSQLRVGHSCEIIGQRQMVVLGGYKDGSRAEPADEFYQGIGIFDMNALRWTGSFNPHAKPYRRPKFIKDTLGDTSSPTEWDDPLVQGLFGGTASGQNHSHKVASYVGALLGVSILAIAVAFLLRFYYRRRKRKTREKKDLPPPYAAVELERYPLTNERPLSQEPLPEYTPR